MELFYSFRDNSFAILKNELTRCHPEYCVAMYNEKVLNSGQTRLPGLSAMYHYIKFDMASQLIQFEKLFIAAFSRSISSLLFYPIILALSLTSYSLLLYNIICYLIEEFLMRGGIIMQQLPTSYPATSSITSIFKNEETKHSLLLFKSEDVQWLETQIFEKNSRPYLKCLASDRDRPAKPEEIVRQLWIWWSQKSRQFEVENKIKLIVS